MKPEATYSNVNPALETPQGQLASSFTAITGNANDTFVSMANQFDPAFAAGRFQDAIGRIYFIDRNPAPPTVWQWKVGPARSWAIISFHFAVSACSGDPGRNAQLSQGSLNEPQGSEGSQTKVRSIGSQAVRQLAQVAI